MVGLNKNQYIGRLGGDVALQVGGNAEQYCYFTLAIPQGKKSDSSGKLVEREPLWVDFSANGYTAKYISTYGKKGMWVYAEGKLSRKQRIVSEGGEKVVYNDFIIRASEVILLPTGANKEDQGSAAEDPKLPEVEPAVSPMANPENDLAENKAGLFFSLSAKEREAAGDLPY